MGGVVADYVERAGPSDIGQVNENDVVLSVNGREVLDLAAAEEVFADLRNEKPAEVILHVLRGQTRLFLKVTPDWE
jgi:S1-C subfamily serine protease